MNATLTRLRSHFSNWRQWEINPIVLKELRQSVRSLAVIVMLHLFLVGLFVTAIIFLAFNGANPSDNERLGTEIFQFFLGILAVASIVFIPLYVGIRVAMERPAGNMDLLYISTLAPGRIIRGKFYCGAYMAILFFSACLPFMAFTNLLRGVDLPSMFAVLTFLFCVICLMNMFAIFLACLPVSIPFKVLLGLYAAIQGLYTVIPILFLSFEMLGSGVGTMMGGERFWTRFLGEFSGGLAVLLLFYFLSVALISPPSSNRALPLRSYITVLWFISGLISVFSAFASVNAAIVGPWAVVSLLLLGASLVVIISSYDELSLRVRRDIPEKKSRRRIAFLFFNGAAGGLVWTFLLLLLTVAAVLVVETYAGTAGAIAAGRVLHRVRGLPVPASVAPEDFGNFTINATVTVFYMLDYALAGLWIHRRFLPHRSPKFAGIIAALLAGICAILPSTVLFFLNKLNLQNSSHLELGNLFNVFMLKDGASRTPHLVCALTVFAVLLLLTRSWFVQQCKRFAPLVAAKPPPLPV